MEESLPLVENKWKKNGKKMEESLPLVENKWKKNGKKMEESFPKVENNLSIRDIDLVPNIESPSMTISRPLKMIMPPNERPCIPLEDIPLVTVDKVEEVNLDKIKILIHLLIFKKFNKI